MAFLLCSQNFAIQLSGLDSSNGSLGQHGLKNKEYAGSSADHRFNYSKNHGGNVGHQGNKTSNMPDNVAWTYGQNHLTGVKSLKTRQCLQEHLGPG